MWALGSYLFTCFTDRSLFSLRVKADYNTKNKGGNQNAITLGTTGSMLHMFICVPCCIYQS